jgi:hypothetical protein
MLSTYEIFLFILVLYCLPFYLFLSPGLVGYYFGKASDTKKGLQALAFVLTPLFPPFVLAWCFLVTVFAFVFMFFAYLVYWIRMHLPFGNIFKAWYRISSRLLGRVRQVLEALFGVESAPPEHAAIPVLFNASSD